MHNTVIEVNQQRELHDGSESLTHQAILRMIHESASRYGITVEETDRQESGVSVRGSFVSEAASLKESIPKLKIPKTKPFSEYRKNIFFPTVAKNEEAHMSKGKFLIENDNQLRNLDEWMNEYGNVGDWVMQEHIQCPSDSYASYRVLVDPTGDIFSSQIVYGAPKGMDIRQDQGGQEDTTIHPSFLLEDPHSKFFLNARSIASNRLFAKKKTRSAELAQRSTTATREVWDESISGYRTEAVPQSCKATREVWDESISGYRTEAVSQSSKVKNDTWASYYNEDGMIGGRLTLDRLPSSHDYSTRERDILKAHGIPYKKNDYPTLPPEIARVASAIGPIVCKEGDRVKELLLGIDFIQNNKTGEHLLLEINRRPRMATVQDLFGGVPFFDKMVAQRWCIERAINNLAIQQASTQG